MFSRFRSRNSIITFDVGSAGIRAFQATARGSHLVRRDALRLELLPSQRPADGELPQPDYSRLARLAGQGSFSGSDIGLVLSPPNVRFCALRLPKKALAQSPKRVREALAWEVAREMRTEAHELEVRYWQLPPRHQQGLNVMAVALPIERAIAWHDVFARERLRLRRIDVSPCALVHIAGRIWSPEENELWGILDLGFHSTTFTVVLGRVPTYIRSLSASSDQWTHRLADAFEVNHASAEQIKRTHGIQPTERGIRASQPDPVPSELMNAQDIPGVVFGLLREPLDNLVYEINRCLAYVLQNVSDVNVTRLLLAGGGANLRGFAEYLELQLDMPVDLLSNQRRGAGATSGLAAGETPALPVELPPTPWERPLVNTTIQPEEAAVIGGAILDLEAQ